MLDLAAFDEATSVDAQAGGDLPAAAERYAAALRRSQVDSTPLNAVAAERAWAVLQRAQKGELRPVRTEPLEPLERLRTLEGLPLSELERIEIPEPKWIVPSFVQEQSFGVVFGPPGSGKTFLATYLAAAAAARNRSVKFIEAEGGAFHLRKRLLRAAAAEGADISNISVVWNPPLDLSRDREIGQLVHACEGFDLVFLDSMAALSGGISENEEGWGQVSNYLAEVRSRSGAAIWPLHHSTKEGWTKGTIPELRHLRGSGALAGRADAALAVVPGDCCETVVAFEVHDLKGREAGKAKPRACTVLMDGPEASFAVAEAADAPGGGRTGESAEELLSRAKLVLRPAPDGTNQQQLRKALRVGLSKLRVALELGRSRGDVVFIQGKGDALAAPQP